MIHWEQEGYEIVGEATNGNEALRLTEELKPHIIISDQNPNHISFSPCGVN